MCAGLGAWTGMSGGRGPEPGRAWSQATHRWRRARGVDWNERRQGDRSRGASGLRPPTDGAGLADPATRRTTMRSGWLLPLLALVVMVAAPAPRGQGGARAEILRGGPDSVSGRLALSGE